MDKENNNSIDDVLKLLKDTYENDSAEEATPLDNTPSEQINTQTLKERLRSQFMNGETVPNEDRADEYSIDEDFINEARESVSVNGEKVEDLTAELPAVEDDAKIENESTEDENALQEDISNASQEDTRSEESVEIVIPFVEAIINSSMSQNQEVDENTDAEPSYGEEDEQEDDQEDEQEEEEAEKEENSGFVLFADDFGGDEDDGEKETSGEELSEQHDSREDENVEPEYIEEELIGETLDTNIDMSSDDFVALNLGEDIVYEDDSSKDTLAESEYGDEETKLDSSKEEDDELPWFDNPVNAVEQANDKDIFFSNDNEENTEEIEDNAEERHIIDNDNAFFEAAEADAEQIDELDALSEAIGNFEVEEENTHFNNATDTIEDGESFYRTMVEARHKRERELGLERDDSIDLYDGTLNQTESTVNDEEEKKEQENDDGNIVSEATVENSEEKLYIPTDYYSATEHTESTDQAGILHKEIDAELEFEEDTGEIGTFKGVFEKNMLLKACKQIILSALALVILVLELLPIIGVVPEGLLDYTSYPWTYILIDAQLLIFMAVMFYDKLLEGIMKLFSRAPNFYSVISLNVLMTLLHNVIICFCTDDGLPSMYNSVSAFCLLAIHTVEKLDIKRSKEAVKTLEAENKVFTLVRSAGKNSCAEKMYSGGVDPDTNIFTPCEVVGGENYALAFSNERLKSDNVRGFSDKIIVFSLMPILVFSILMAVASMVFGQDLVICVNAFIGTFLFLSPVAAVIGYYLPIFITHHRLYPRGCVITGYCGAEQVATSDALVFFDTHLFAECTSRNAGIKLYCDQATTRRLFVCLATSYRELGGPMEKTFASILSDPDESHRIRMIRITRSGFEAVVDSRTNIIVGSAEYLARYGIVTDRADDSKGGVIYAAMDSKLCAKINVNYRIHPLFEALCAMLDMYGIRTVVETYDPIISGKYVARSRKNADGLSPISIVHKNADNYNEKAQKKISSQRVGAFATSSRLKLCELAIFCKRLTGLRKLNMMILALSFAVAAILSTILVVSGAVENVNLLWMLVYQSVLIAVYFLTARSYLPFSFDRMMQNEVERKAESAKDSNDEKNNTEKISKEADQDEQD